MARQAFKATLGTDLGDGQFLVDASSTPDPALDVATAVAELATVTADAATAAASTDAADTAAGTADTDLATVVGADQTAVEAAVALLETDGATPTQAHVNALRTVWDTLVADATIAKAATVAAKSATATAKADAAAIDTTATSDALTAATTNTGYNFIVTVDTAVVTTGNALRRLSDAFLRAAQASGML